MKMGSKNPRQKSVVLESSVKPNQQNIKNTESEYRLDEADLLTFLALIILSHWFLNHLLSNQAMVDGLAAKGWLGLRFKNH